MSKVVFHDDRPYGEDAVRVCWLARYDSVIVHAPDSNEVTVTLSLALDSASGELVCAFTDPAPQWAKPKGYLNDIEARAGERWTISRARYPELQSTLTQVLETLWKSEGVDPGEAGQIVIRPRLVLDKSRRIDSQQRLLPSDPPANAWIIEVLGTFVMERYGSPLTTHVLLLRDGSLEFSGGMILP